MKKIIFKGEGLRKRIHAVVNQLLYDDAITPGQISVKKVAEKVPCSRVAIYENSMASVIRLAQEQKARNVDYGEKLKKARKPRLIKLQDRVQELKDENEKLRQSNEKLEQLFNRLLINVMLSSNKIGIDKDIDELLSRPIEPLEFKRHVSFVKRKKENYLEKLIRIRELSKAKGKGVGA